MGDLNFNFLLPHFPTMNSFLLKSEQSQRHIAMGRREEKPGTGGVGGGSKAGVLAWELGQSALSGACFDKSVVPLVAWVVSKL